MEKQKPTQRDIWPQPSMQDVVQRPQPPKNEVVVQQMERFSQEQTEKEASPIAQYCVHIDHDALARIEIPAGKPYGIRDEKEREEELRGLLDRMKRLPERLDFQPGITLIVGRRGAGKSTLGKALYYNAYYEQQVLSEKQMAVLTDNPEEFARAEQDAYELVFEPSRSVPGIRLALNQAGLAPAIAKALRTQSFYSHKQSGMGIGYHDFPQVIGYQSRNEWEYVREHVYSDPTDGWDDHQSHRQTVDRLGFENIQRESAWYKGPQIYFFDEPETGMDPYRHRAIEQELLDITTAGSILIIPTNSIILFDSDLPRIDLEHPDRGIHRPSQYAA